MRERKTTAKSTSQKKSGARAKSNGSRKSSRTSRSSTANRSQSSSKRASSNRKDLQKKIAEITAEWKEKLRRVEDEAFEKAKQFFEREFARREEGRKKAVDAAVAKYDKQFSKKQRTGAKKTARSRSRTGSRSTSRTASKSVSARRSTSKGANKKAKATA